MFQTNFNVRNYTRVDILKVVYYQKKSNECIFPLVCYFLPSQPWSVYCIIIMQFVWKETQPMSNADTIVIHSFFYVSLITKYNNGVYTARKSIQFMFCWPCILIHLCNKNSSIPTWPTDSQLKSTTHTNCCKYTVYLLMMGYKYARNV